MNKRALGVLSTEEFEELVERAIDRRLEVWFTQLMDALIGLQEEEDTALNLEFADALRLSLEQARSGKGVDLGIFRSQITDEGF